jgi:uncharacterized protein YutE (UPF0331/DUF86 family)
MKEEFKERLVKHLNFFEEEIKDYLSFKNVTWEIYRTNKSKRREVERWIENLVNSSIDISKLILTAENITLPETYREIVSSMTLVKGFDKEEAEKLSHWVRLRNIVAHEYLDIRWNAIKKFIQETEPVYKDFFEKVKKYLKGKCSE